MKVKVIDLPLGARFRYLNGEDVWVLIDRAGCGVIAREPDINKPLWQQGICSIEESEKATRELVVEYVEVKEV